MDDSSNSTQENENVQEMESITGREETIDKQDAEDTKTRSHISLKLLWEYYTRLEPFKNKIAECNICQKTISFKSTTGNLRVHISRKHPQVMDKNNAYKYIKKYEEDNPKTRRNRGRVWHYFRKVTPLKEFKAQCRVCFQIFSYKTSISNLKTHMVRKHYEVVKDDAYFKGSGYLDKRSRKNVEKIKFYEYLDLSTDAEDNDGNNVDNNDEAVKLTSQIWAQFNHDDEEPTCNLCRQLVDNTLEDMKTHLEEKHADVFDTITAVAMEAASDEEVVLNDDNTYTEIVYLEDESSKTEDPPKKRTQVKQDRHSSTNKHKKHKTRELKRTISESSDETIFIPKKISQLKSQPDQPKSQPDEPKSQPDELDAFLNYLKTLLQKVPTENSSKLHLDIINLVMAAVNPPQTQKSCATENTKPDQKESNLPSDGLVQPNDSVFIPDTNTSIGITSPKIIATLQPADEKCSLPRLIISGPRQFINASEIQKISSIINKSHFVSASNTSTNTGTS